MAALIKVELFGSVCYCVLEGTVENEHEIDQILGRGGAVKESFISTLVTHIITDEQVNDVHSLLGDDCNAVVVNSKWVRLSMKCGLLLPTPPFEMSGNKLLTNMVICPTQVSVSDREKIWALVTYNGGHYQGTLNDKVTHLIGLEPHGPKYEEATKHNIKIVTPEWLLNSINQGVRLPEEEYSIQPQTSSLTVQTLLVTTSTVSVIQSGKKHTINGHHDTLLSPVLGTDGSLVDPRESEREMEVEQSTGKNGEEERDASLSLENSQTNKEPEEDLMETEEREFTKVDSMIEDSLIVNIDHRDQLHLHLHKPLAVVSTQVSFDKESVSPTPQPTPLMEKGGIEEGTSERSQEKKETLLEGLVLCIVDYPELMDKETIQKWKEVIYIHGGEVINSYNSLDCTHLLAQNKESEVFIQASSDNKCISSAHWLNDVLSQQQMFPPCKPLHFPLAYKEAPSWCEKMSVTITNYVGIERELIRDMIRIAGIPFTGHLSQTTTHLVCKRGEGRKFDKACQWNINIVNATFIADIIHNGQLPSVHCPKYTTLGEEDEFNVSCFEAIKLLKPWQFFIAKYALRHKELLDEKTCQTCFTGFSPIKLDVPQPEEIEIDLTISDEPTTMTIDEVTKKNGGQSLKPPAVMFTGLNPAIVKRYKQSCLALGGSVTTNPRECTYLVAPQIARTVKFLSAISVCDFIVTPNWMDDCIKENCFLDGTPYILSDQEAEDMFLMTIPSSLEKSKQRKLLKGLVIYSTPNVTPPHESLKLIIECAGGELLTQEELTTRYGKKLERLASDGCVLIVISCLEDISLCEHFFKFNILVFNAEFILTGVLRQTLNYNQNRIIN